MDLLQKFSTSSHTHHGWHQTQLLQSTETRALSTFPRCFLLNPLAPSPTSKGKAGSTPHTEPPAAQRLTPGLAGTQTPPLVPLSSLTAARQRFLPQAPHTLLLPEQLHRGQLGRESDARAVQHLGDEESEALPIRAGAQCQHEEQSSLAPTMPL